MLQLLFSSSLHRFTSIILSHFILDLRHGTDGNQMSIPNQTTVQFAHKVEDGLGTSLNNTWWDGNIDECGDGHEDVQPIESPMVSHDELGVPEGACTGR